MANDAKPDNRSYNDRVAAEIRARVNEMLAADPDLRSVLVVFDWKGALNDARGVIKGLWAGEDGGVPADPAAVFGTAQNTIGALAEVMARAIHVEDLARGRLKEVAAQVEAKRKELAKLDEQLDAAWAAGQAAAHAAQDPAPAGPGVGGEPGEVGGGAVILVPEQHWPEAVWLEAGRVERLYFDSDYAILARGFTDADLEARGYARRRPGDRDRHVFVRRPGSP